MANNEFNRNIRLEDHPEISKSEQTVNQILQNLVHVAGVFQAGNPIRSIKSSESLHLIPEELNKTVNITTCNDHLLILLADESLKRPIAQALFRPRMKTLLSSAEVKFITIAQASVDNNKKWNIIKTTEVKFPLEDRAFNEKTLDATANGTTFRQTNNPFNPQAEKLSNSLSKALQISNKAEKILAENPEEFQDKTPNEITETLRRKLREQTDGHPPRIIDHYPPKMEVPENDLLNYSERIKTLLRKIYSRTPEISAILHNGLDSNIKDIPSCRKYGEQIRVVFGETDYNGSISKQQREALFEKYTKEESSLSKLLKNLKKKIF